MTLRAVSLVLAFGVLAAGCSDSSSSKKSSSSAATTAASTSATTSPFSGGSGTPSTNPSTPAGPTTTPTAPMAGAWYVGDLHSHSATHSDDARRQGGDPIDVTVRVAEAVGLDYLAGTDHRTNDVLTDPNFSSQTMVLLAGMEWGGSMHAGAIGQNAPITPNTSTSGAALISEVDAIIADVQAKGGVFTLNHPVDPGKLWVVAPQAFDAIEVWNSQWSMTAFARAEQSDLDDKMRSAGLDAIGYSNPHIQAAVADQRGSYNLQALTLYESYLNAGRRIAAVGGGDRHMLFAQGRPTTHVYARARTKQGILDGIREARTFISRLPTGPLVDFTADANNDGVYEALIGDEVNAGQLANFRVVVEGADGGRVDVIKNGQVLFSEPVQGNTHVLALTDTPATGDWYRVDVYEKIPSVTLTSQGILLQAAQATGRDWAALAAIVSMMPGSAYDTTLGTLLPTIFPPNEIDMLMNASLKDVGYSRGAITSAIYTR